MKRAFVLCVFLSCFLLKSNVYSNELIIYGDDEGPPKYYLENGVPKGIIVEMMEFAGKEVGTPFEIKLLPWARAYKYAVAGKGGIIGLSMNNERLKIFNYSVPMFYNELMLVVKKGSEFPFKTIPDLKGKIVSVSIGTSYGDAYELAIKDGVFKVSEEPNLNYCLYKLLIGKVDVVLISLGKYRLNQLIEKHPRLKSHRDEFVILPTPFKRDPNYLGIPKKLGIKAYLEKFNRAIKKGYESGKFDQIIRKYLN